MSGKTLYIAYGSNMNLEQMALRCPNAKVVGNAKLQNYEILFRGAISGAVATIEKRKGGTVPVVAWELEPSDERALDRYEGFPTFYRKEYVNVKIDGRLTKVMVYIMNNGYEIGIPSQRYFDIIKQGYQTAGFDTSFLLEALNNSSALVEQKK